MRRVLMLLTFILDVIIYTVYYSVTGCYRIGYFIAGRKFNDPTADLLEQQNRQMNVLYTELEDIRAMLNGATEEDLVMRDHIIIERGKDNFKIENGVEENE